MVKVAIIGASGYTGAEAIEIILRHPQAELSYLTALPEECGQLDDIFGQFKGRCRMQIEHGTGMEVKHPLTIIDEAYA